jgi:hypothetical protein
MPPLDNLCQSIKTLCDDLYTLRNWPRPPDADWRHHQPSKDGAREQRGNCQKSVDVCLKSLEEARPDVPQSWLGHDPETSKYIRLKRAFETIRYWLHEFQRPFRGYKMPMDSDDQDQHDDPADVKDWNEAEMAVRRLGDELRDYIDLAVVHSRRSDVGGRFRTDRPIAPSRERTVNMSFFARNNQAIDHKTPKNISEAIELLESALYEIEIGQRKAAEMNKADPPSPQEKVDALEFPNARQVIRFTEPPLNRASINPSGELDCKWDKRGRTLTIFAKSGNLSEMLGNWKPQTLYERLEGELGNGTVCGEWWPVFHEQVHCDIEAAVKYLAPICERAGWSADPLDGLLAWSVKESPFDDGALLQGVHLLMAKLRRQGEQQQKDEGPKKDPATPKPTHSADFAFVDWYGTPYTFALGVQSSAVQTLWAEWETTGLGLHQDTIRNAIDAERDSFRMDNAFRNHPAFGTMIRRCGDGRYRLVLHRT